MSEAQGSIGPFDIRGELGRGAMAVVWRGYDPSLDREVAIKEPRLPEGSDDAARVEFGERFVREARAAARLNHPGIVAIYAAGMYDERPAIVMELVDGRTLREVLEGGALSTRQTYAVLDQLLAAVGYAHEHGVVHRDLKPDNVFVARDGTVKLADFGIAQLGQEGGALTRPGTLLGTPAYMAPEQIRGEPVDAACDVFALGVIAYECLAGQNPFGDGTSTHYATIIHRITSEPVPMLCIGDDLVGSLAGVIGAALVKERERRFRTASAMLGAWRASFAESIDTKAELVNLESTPARPAATPVPRMPEHTLIWGASARTAGQASPAGGRSAPPGTPSVAKNRRASAPSPSTSASKSQSPTPPKSAQRKVARTASGVEIDPSAPGRCPACHKELVAGERFCRGCGRLVKRAGRGPSS